MIALIALPLLRIDNQWIASADNFYLLIAHDCTFWLVCTKISCICNQIVQTSYIYLMLIALWPPFLAI